MNAAANDKSRLSCTERPAAQDCGSLDQNPRVSAMGGWTLREYREVTSTNLVAANLVAWEAVRSDTQTAGRGRFQRRWVSDQGGLWLSACVPCDATTAAGRALPLVAGLAVCDALREIGIREIRMRWPNDVLVNDRKLAGLLIDQFIPGLAVVGIGVNLRNQPEAHDPKLAGLTTRLVDLISVPPTLAELSALILRHLRRVVSKMQTGDFSELLPGVNNLWGRPRKVELDLDGNLRRGMFERVDEAGQLILLDETGKATTFAPAHVRHLTEIT